MKLKKLTAYGYSHIVLPALVVVSIAAVGTYVLNTSHAAAICKKSTFSSGRTGTCVQDIQYIVNGECSIRATTHYPSCSKLATDGQYGAKTIAQVKVFQKFVGLSQDGVVGPKTWTWMCNAAKSATRNTNGDTHFEYSAAKDAGCYV